MIMIFKSMILKSMILKSMIMIIIWSWFWKAWSHILQCLKRSLPVKRSLLEFPSMTRIQEPTHRWSWKITYRHTWYLSFFLHAHILSHENFIFGKCINLQQNCPKQYFYGSSGIFLHSSKNFTRTAFMAFVTNIRYGIE